MYCYTHCSQPCSRPPPTHASTGDSGHAQASLGQSLVGSLLLYPGSWCTLGSVCAPPPPRVYFSVLCKFWQLFGGVNGDLLQESLCHTQVCSTQSPSLWHSTADSYFHRRCSNTVLSQSLWGTWVLVSTTFV